MKNKRISYSVFIRNSTIFTITVITIIFAAYGYFIKYDKIQQSIFGNTSVEIDLIFESMYSTMKNGGTKEQIHTLINDLDKKLPHAKVSLHSELNAATEHNVEEAFKAKTMKAFHHLDHVDFVKPILYEKACIQCHSNATIGEVAAVIQLEQDYSNIGMSLHDFINMIIIFSIISALAIFVNWYVLLKKYVVNPIEEVTQQIKRISSHDDLNHSLNVETSIEEIKKIEDAFNIQNEKLYKLYKDLENSSFMDPLTNIFNRKMFDSIISKEFANAKRYNHDLTLINIDLNEFKFINDTYGHQTGDKLLQFFTNSVSSIVRESDFFFRVGGDEFMILLPKSSAKNAQSVIEKVKEYFSEYSFKIEELNYHLKASFGVAELGNEATTIEDLIKISDINMYEDKIKSKKV